MRPRIRGKLRQTFLAVVLFLTTAPSPSLHAHSSLPTHVVAVGGDRAVIWNDQTASFDVHSLCDGSFLHALDLGAAMPNQVLFDESRREFFGTGSGKGERSYVWQWKVSQSRPTVTPVVSAGRLWSVHQHGGKRYVVYTAAGGAQIKLGELDRSLNVIEIMDLPDLVPKPEGCIVSGPAAPGEGAPYWIDFSAGRVEACKGMDAQCEIPAWLQVTTGHGDVLLSEASCNTFFLMKNDRLLRRSPVPLAADDAAIHRLFVDPARDRAVYALAGSRANLPEKLELWKSKDDGSSWQRVALKDRRPVNLFFTEKGVLVESAGPELTILDKKGAPLRVQRLHPRQ